MEEPAGWTTLGAPAPSPASPPIRHAGAPGGRRSEHCPRRPSREPSSNVAKSRIGGTTSLGKRWLAGLFAGLVAAAAVGQYSIDWYKIGGGGGTSSNGQYTASGTIGQHDAGAPMSGGAYSVTGGFWSLYAVPTPGAPRLTIFLTPTNTAVISWPSPSTGFALQQNDNLTGTNWVTPSETENDNGTTRSIIVSPSIGNQFYRLRHP